MKLSITPFLFLFSFILSSYSAQALLTTTSPSTPSISSTLNKADLESILGRKLKAKEKLGLWVLRRKLKKAKRRNPLLFKKMTTPTDTSKCATILFLSGAKLQAKIIEISDTSVDFIRCGQSDTLSLSKWDIEEIVLYDGIKIFQNDGKYTAKKRRRKRKPSDNLGIVAILFGLFAIGLLAVNIPLAIICGLLAMLFGISGINADYAINKGIAAFGGLTGLTTLIINTIRKNNLD